jgi:hypothetical protein
VDTRQKGILILAAAWPLLCACTPHDQAQVPDRANEMPSLVRAGELDVTAFAGRNDPTLGIERHPIVRSTTHTTESTIDLQRVIDGRPYIDFRVTTRTRESLRR